MHVLVSGASGLIGSAVVAALRRDGHQASPLRRGNRFAADEFAWNPGTGEIRWPTQASLDAVIHLAGENIAQRWSARAKERIRDSRVEGTRLLTAALARLAPPPRVLIAASAVGVYGDCGEEWLTEQSPPGRGFLAEVCQQWESATEAAQRAGVRVVRLRIGMVLAATGGALARMLPVFRLGLGGTLGAGQQYWSWIALEDLVAAIRYALASEALSGPVNAIAPEPVTNAEFTRTLARVLKRPARLRVPTWVVRAVFGQMGNELLLASAQVRPRRLEEAGFHFQWPGLESALRHVLNRPRA